jgi:integrase
VLIGRNPFLMYEKPRVPERRPVFLSKEEVDQLLTVVRDSQMKAIILMALCTAMRLGEIVHLRWADVDLAGRIIKLANRDDFQLKTR